MQQKKAWNRVSNRLVSFAESICDAHLFITGLIVGDLLVAMVAFGRSAPESAGGVLAETNVSQVYRVRL